MLRRLLQAVGVLWAAYTATFLILWALPGDPVRILAGPDATDLSDAQLDALRHELGLDRPLWLQYVDGIGQVLRGDLGRSIGSGRPVADLIAAALPSTLQITALGIVLAILGGTGVAIAATLTRSRVLARVLLALPPVGVAVPGFWFGLLLIQWFSFQLRWLPALGDKTWTAAILPSIALALPTGAAIAQLLSKSLATTLREPYVDAVWAKGAGRGRVHFAHALRNAALPALTYTGVIVGGLLSGTVVTETVFSRPGIGRLTATAVTAQDIPIVQGVVLFAALVFVVVSLVVDLLYPLLDPRIRLAGPRARARAREAFAGAVDADAPASAAGLSPTPTSATAAETTPAHAAHPRTELETTGARS
nr:ABC transporter permease [Schumannella luteola]